MKPERRYAVVRHGALSAPVGRRIMHLVRGDLTYTQAIQCAAEFQRAVYAEGDVGHDRLFYEVIEKVRWPQLRADRGGVSA